MRKNKVIYDAYKPQKAVDNFVRWIKNDYVTFSETTPSPFCRQSTYPSSEKNARMPRNTNLLQIKKAGEL